MKLIIFDLDGTLVDSRLDIANSVNELMVQLQRPTLPHDRIYGSIGDGVRCLVERCLGEALRPEVDQAVDMYLPIYRRRLLETTHPYPGVREALDELARDKILAVLTNKPTRESAAILEGLDLASFFRFVHGGDSFPSRKPDPIGIRLLLERTGAGREQTLMVGDSCVDFETARNAGVPICLVSYRLGGARISTLAPDYLVDDLRHLVTLLRPTSGR